MCHASRYTTNKNPAFQNNLFHFVLIKTQRKKYFFTYQYRNSRHLASWFIADLRYGTNTSSKFIKHTLFLLYIIYKICFPCGIFCQSSRSWIMFNYFITVIGHIFKTNCKTNVFYTFLRTSLNIPDLSRNF